jgi:FtsP/CotA-like multicopper oxidase with cupredoxin domain
MVRIGLMERPVFRLDRRELLAGIGIAALSPAMPAIAAAQGRQSLTLRAQAAIIALRPGQTQTPIWSLQGPAPEPGVRFRRHDELEIRLQNELPVSTVLNWRGIDGMAAAEPLTARPSVAPNERENLVIPLRQAGTLLCDIRLLGDGQARSSRAVALVIEENEVVPVDRDEVFLVEDWRLRPDGTAMAPGSDPGDATAVCTVNGLPALEITARAHDRLRLRFVNGFQRSVIAIKIENYEVRVMALDSQPAEPFQARNGALVLAPGGRIDVFVDVTGSPGTTSAILLHDGRASHSIGRLVVSNDPPIRTTPLPPAPALPTNGLPARLDLRNALRFDLELGGAQDDWIKPANFAGSVAPAFRARAGRIVVLALINRADSPVVFHLHGHHFRLLDRLDDGWKPFWLDTLAIESGQTQRIAFAAEYPGRWLLETMATDWAAPRLVRWYSVE